MMHNGLALPLSGQWIYICDCGHQTARYDSIENARQVHEWHRSDSIA